MDRLRRHKRKKGFTDICAKWLMTNRARRGKGTKLGEGEGTELGEGKGTKLCEEQR